MTIIRSHSSTPSATYGRTLLDGASLYGISQFSQGEYCRVSVNEFRSRPRRIQIALAETVPSSAYGQTLLDGASLYGIDQTGTGRRLSLAVVVGYPILTGPLPLFRRAS